MRNHKGSYARQWCPRHHKAHRWGSVLLRFFLENSAKQGIRSSSLVSLARILQEQNPDPALSLTLNLSRYFYGTRSHSPVKLTMVLAGADLDPISSSLTWLGYLPSTYRISSIQRCRIRLYDFNVLSSYSTSML